MKNFIPTIITGAGATGLFCAVQLGYRLVFLIIAKKISRKILMSGDGFCLHTSNS